MSTEEEYILLCLGCHIHIKIPKLGRLGTLRASFFAKIEAHLDEHGRMIPMEFAAEYLFSSADSRVPEDL